MSHTNKVRGQSPYVIRVEISYTKDILSPTSVGSRRLKDLLLCCTTLIREGDRLESETAIG